MTAQIIVGSVSSMIAGSQDAAGPVQGEVVSVCEQLAAFVPGNRITGPQLYQLLLEGCSADALAVTQQVVVIEAADPATPGRPSPTVSSDWLIVCVRAPEDPWPPTRPPRPPQFVRARWRTPRESRTVKIISDTPLPYRIPRALPRHLDVPGDRIVRALVLAIQENPGADLHKLALAITDGELVISIDRRPQDDWGPGFFAQADQ